MSAAAISNYHDLQGLAALSSQARQAPGEAVEEVATQFESLFMQMMLKSMRDATIEGGLFDSSQLDLYQQMFDQQVSLDLSKQGGLGLAEVLVKQLEGTQAAVELTGESEASEPLVPLNNTASQNHIVSDFKRQVLALQTTQTLVDEAANDTVAEVSPLVNKPVVDTQDWLPSSPEEFVEAVWDHAVVAAKALGVDPSVLVAQSALETGWGKKVIRTEEGTNSFNLFGIKASHGWSGDSASVNTLEFRDGVAAQEKATFRAYDTLASAFDDYVSFLKTNPRYQQALEKVSDSKEFLSELQDAGYATDPKYAEKILGILDRGNYSAQIKQLKLSQLLSLKG